MTATTPPRWNPRRARTDYEMLIHAAARLWKRGDFEAAKILRQARQQMQREWPWLPEVEAHQRRCPQCRVIWHGLGLRV